MCRKLIYLVSFMLILSTASGVQADMITVGSDADTYMRDDVVRGPNDFMDIRGGSLDFAGYLRFDLSGLDIITIRKATLTLIVSGHASRNDTVTNGRFALYGLDNVEGNTAQNWDENVLTEANVGIEWILNNGDPLFNVTDLDGDVNGITETVVRVAGTNYSDPGGTIITITGDVLVNFIQSRVNDGGLVTFIIKNDDTADRGYGIATKENANEAIRPKLELVAVTKTTPVIIYVTDVPDRDLDGVYDDDSFINWIKDEGYNVDARRSNWTVLDVNKITELEAADLIIIGRGTDTGLYNQTDEPNQWNNLTTPMLCVNPWQIRSNRFKWVNSTAAVKDAGSPPMMVLDPNHSIFAGVTIDADGLVEVLDPNVGSGSTSFINDLNVGNGNMLAQSLGIYNVPWIVEWDAGVEYYAGAGQIAGGKRILFNAGTQDAVPGQTIQQTPQGAFNLNAEGQKLLRNIIAYLAPKTLFNFETDLTGWEYNTWDAPAGSISIDTVGATSGLQSLKINAPWDGWRILAFYKFQNQLDPNALAAVTNSWLTSATLEMDITIDPADWAVTDPNSAWFSFLVISNSQNGGWTELSANQGNMTDNVNPGFPGGWDPVNFPTKQTRHIVCDITALNDKILAAGGPGTYFEFFICKNSGSLPNGGILYVDNVRLCP